MSRRRTVEDWRRAVFRARTSGNVQVLLLLLAEHMRTDLSVSVPRATLAAALGIHEQRVADRVKAAIEAGWLFKTGGGYRGRTTEYRGLFPDQRVQKIGTHSGPERVRPTSTHSTPEIGTHSPEECVPPGGSPITTADLSLRGADRNVGSNGHEACQWHEHIGCPEDCAGHPDNRQESA